MDLSRTVIIGMGGSGKTTLGRSLAKTLNTSHIELDALFWRPNWTPCDRAVFLQEVDQATLGSSWVVDGNYGSVRDLLWGKATTIIWLDYSFVTIFRQVFSRTIRRMLSREVLFSGNQESFRLAFLDRDSLIWYTITQYRQRRRKFQGWFAENDYHHISRLIFKRPAETAQFLNQVRRQDP